MTDALWNDHIPVTMPNGASVADFFAAWDLGELEKDIARENDILSTLLALRDNPNRGFADSDQQVDIMAKYDNLIDRISRHLERLMSGNL